MGGFCDKECCKFMVLICRDIIGGVEISEFIGICGSFKGF